MKQAGESGKGGVEGGEREGRGGGGGGARGSTGGGGKRMWGERKKEMKGK